MAAGKHSRFSFLYSSGSSFGYEGKHKIRSMSSLGTGVYRRHRRFFTMIHPGTMQVGVFTVKIWRWQKKKGARNGKIGPVTYVSVCRLRHSMLFVLDWLLFFFDRENWKWERRRTRRGPRLFFLALWGALHLEPNAQPTCTTALINSKRSLLLLQPPFILFFSVCVPLTLEQTKNRAKKKMQNRKKT